ncbi:SusD/RagB family nutrient-binding outer membrane lipoprotein [Marinifilum flexuosum]|uniref:SusD/RagB family nutrient-binding outer membrane lipoprotein n=1 Tax=Marinifilum flexuosum TaxID=1117708 RepID=UPI0024944B39|nr:SusD/RagB family nutrient-binding outer membrane lipoprotein [Marinifilum flexuosum]
MKFNNYLYALLGIMLLSQACSDDFGDMNVPSDSATQVEPRFFLHDMQMEVFANYQRNVSLYPDLYSQYWANTVSGFGSARYEYVDGWIGNQWKEFYTRQLPKSIAISDTYGEDPYYVDAIAIKEIWICYYWSRMTDSYGDIPYFGVGKGESVAYNPQSEVYADLFKRLDNAVNSITGDAAQYRYSDGYDLIYDGDALQWRKFGNSLRLRLAMRISNVDPEKAKTEALAAINGPGGVFESNADVVKVPMWSKGWNDYLHQMGWSWNNIRMSKTMSDYLYNTSSIGEDPRTPKWFTYQRTIDDKKVGQTKEQVSKEKYYGLENGFNTVPAKVKEDFAAINLNGGYIDFVGDGGEHKMYCPVMFFSEVQFLKAEAALRGWISEDANALYLSGVQASMDYVGVASSDATDYINGLSNLGGSNEEQLKQIITQKWIANFPNGVEGWADFRRTDYPDITLPKDGVSGSSTVDVGSWVKRIRYPNNQHEQNSANIPSSMNTKDTDKMGIRVWWDTADTKDKVGGLMSSNF